MKPNFSKAYSNANEILVKSHVISTFPFSPIDLVKEQTSIVCRTYEKARKYGLDICDFGSESAVLFSKGGKYMLFYDNAKPMTHIGFSVLHEMGHPMFLKQCIKVMLLELKGNAIHEQYMSSRTTVKSSALQYRSAPTVISLAQILEVQRSNGYDKNNKTYSRV